MVTETKAQLPIPIDKSQTFTVCNQRYEILRYAEGKGPTLEQTIETAKNRGKEVLTHDEAREIVGNDEASIVFRDALKQGEWGFVRYKKVEKKSLAGCIYHYGRYFDVACLHWPSDAAPVVILKEADSSGPKSATVALVHKLLRGKQ